MAYYILNILTFVCGVFIIYRFYSMMTLNSVPFYKHLQKIKAKQESDKDRVKSRERTRKFLNRLMDYTQSIKFLESNKKRDAQLEYIALRRNFIWHDVHITEDHLSAILDAISLVYMGIVILISVVDLRFLVLIVFYRAIQAFIIKMLESEIKEYDEEIANDFYAFHARIYHIYKHKTNQNIPIPDVMMRYYPNANAQIKRMIDLFRADYQLTPDKALDRLKAHYRIDKVYRMANELLLIQTGKTVELDMLESFQKELEAEHRLKAKRELEKKKEKSEMILNLNILILLEVIVIWAICLILANK